MSKAATVPPRATYADLAALPDDVVGELLAGELVVSPRPSIPHAIASSAANGTLTPPFQFGDGGPGGWWILHEPELHLRDDVLVPDLAGWRRERMPTPPRAPYLDLAPDWVCEVLSPATARIDRVRKMAIYAAHGVGHAWLLDPIARTLEVYALDGERWLRLGAYENDDVIRAEPFTEITIDLLRFWGEARG